MRKTSTLLQTTSRFVTETKGSVFVYVALALPIFLGLAGLSIDVSVWHAEKRQTQSMADSAALAAALELRRGGNPTNAATLDAQENGYSAGALSSFDVNSPPLSGDFTADTAAVEVIVRRPVMTFMASLVFQDQPYVEARAVARGQNDGACLYALNPNKQAAVQVAGGADLNMNCGIFSNSNDAASIQVQDGSSVNAPLTKTAGNVAYSGSGTVSPAPVTGAPQISDPMASLDPPVGPAPTCSAGIDSDVQASDGHVVFPAGTVYCSTVKVRNGGHATFAPGLHIIHGTNVLFNGGSTVNGTGVTLYFTGGRRQQRHTRHSKQRER